MNRRGWVRLSVLVGILVTEGTFLALQAIEIPIQAIMASAISTFVGYLIWLGLGNVKQGKQLTEILTLLRGDGGLVERMDTAELKIGAVPGLIGAAMSEARDAMVEPFSDYQEHMTRRIEGLEERERERLSA